MKKKYLSIFWYIAAIAIIVADRAVKRYIMSHFEQGTVFGGLPGVADFIYVKNTGAAFSMLSGSTFMLSGISIVFSVAVAIYWIVKKDKHPLLELALVLLFSGAVGNAVDRIAYKYVVDFISVKWFDFPVFNIADIAIVAGALAAVIFVIFFDEDKEKDE